MVSIWLIFATIVVCALIYYVFLSSTVDYLLHGVHNEPKIIHNYIPFFGYLFQFMKDPFGFICWVQKKHGDRVALNLLTHRHIFLYDQATFVNRITKDSRFTLEFLDQQFHSGGNVSWKCLKNNEAQQALTSQFLENLSGRELVSLNQRTYDFLKKRILHNASDSVPKIVNIFDFVGEIMSETALTVLYGEQFAKSQVGFYSSFRRYMRAMGKTMIDIPFKSYFLRDALHDRDEFIDKFMNLKRNDDMSKLIQARIEVMESFGTEVFNERDKAGIHSVFCWISLLNTLPTTSWAVVDLFLNPEALKAVKAELAAQVTNIDSLCEKETLAKLTTLDACIEETMRRVILVLIQRQASQDAVVTCMNGTPLGIRKNDIIVCPELAKQFDARSYPQPYEYKYNRSTESKIKPPQILWFGAGTRMCPGRYWAINEIKIFVALMLLKLDIQFLMDEEYQNKMRTRLNSELDSFLIDLGPYEKDKHHFRMQYTVKQ